MVIERPFGREMVALARAVSGLRNAINRSQAQADPQAQEALERMRSALRDLSDLLGFGDVVDEADMRE